MKNGKRRGELSDSISCPDQAADYIKNEKREKEKEHLIEHKISVIEFYSSKGCPHLNHFP